MAAERAVVNILITDFELQYLGIARRVQSKCGFTYLQMQSCVKLKMDTPYSRWLN